MPSDWVPADIFMVHRGIPVYYVYRHDVYGDTREYHYSLTAASSDDADAVGGFDVRDLPTWSPGAYPEAFKAAISQAIDSGYFDSWEDEASGQRFLANLDQPFVDDRDIVVSLSLRQRQFLCCVVGYWLDEHMDELPASVTGQLTGGQMTRSEARDLVLRLGGDPENPRGD